MANVESRGLQIENLERVVVWFLEEKNSEEAEVYVDFTGGMNGREVGSNVKSLYAEA